MIEIVHTNGGKWVFVVKDDQGVVLLGPESETQEGAAESLKRLLDVVASNALQALGS